MNTQQLKTRWTLLAERPFLNRELDSIKLYEISTLSSEEQMQIKMHNPQHKTTTIKKHIIHYIENKQMRNLKLPKYIILQ